MTLTMSTIAITGGTGMFGKILTQALVLNGHSVIILSRRPATENRSGDVKYAHWDPVAGTIDAAAISEADHIIHLGT